MRLKVQSYPKKPNTLNPKSRRFGSDEFPFHFEVIFRFKIIILGAVFHEFNLFHVGFSMYTPEKKHGIWKYPLGKCETSTQATNFWVPAICFRGGAVLLFFLYSNQTASFSKNILLMEEIRNNPPVMYETIFKKGIFSMSSGARFLNHQQYHSKICPPHRSRGTISHRSWEVWKIIDSKVPA